jgi:hypothetical protein
MNASSKENQNTILLNYSAMFFTTETRAAILGSLARQKGIREGQKKDNTEK